MDNLRWTNPGQPQTLQISVFLAYFRAVFLILATPTVYRLLPFDILGDGLSRVFPFLMFAGFLAGAVGTASERKWGLIALRVTAVYAVVAVIWFMIRAREIFDLNLLLRLMFDGVLVVVLFHEQTRNYAKVWFK